MVDQGRDILQEHVQAGIQRLRHLGAAHEVGNQALLIHDILADHHRVLLELGDIDQEFLVDVLLLVDALRVLGDLLREELDHIRIQVDTLVQDRGEDRETGGILLRVHLHPTLEFGEAAEGHLAERREGIVHEGERHRLHHVFLGPRSQEVRVGEDGIVRLEIAGGAFDFLRLCAALDFRPEEALHGALFRAGRIHEVDPDGVLEGDLGEIFLRLGDSDLSVFPVEDIQHIVPACFSSGPVAPDGFYINNQLPLRKR